MSKADEQSRPEKTLSRPLACRVGPTQHQDHTGHGEVELPYAGDDRKGDMGLSVGLQPDPVTDGSIGLISRPVTPSTQLQTYPAAMDCLETKWNRL